MIVFENDGQIDIRSIKIMGVSVKTGVNPIGYFGTGLKYSIAILNRENIGLTLFTGGKRYTFSKKQVSIREKGFDLISMNEEELPFTTEFGKNWELWQAFRELYCNTIDENGKIYEIDEMSDINFEHGKTYFITDGKKFDDIFKRKHEIILNYKKELRAHETPSMEVYNVQNNYLYYRGIRVANLEKSSIYTWNILQQQQLTEDRTLTYRHSAIQGLAQEVSTLKDKKFIESILLAPNEYFESCFDFDFLEYTTFASQEFLEVLDKVYKSNDDRINKTAARIHAKMKGADSLKDWPPHEMTVVQSKQLERAKTVLQSVYPNCSKYEIIIVKDLGQNTMALANFKMRKIIVSAKCFDHGTKYLLSTLIEEYMHLETGYNDLTRELQTHLFDSIVSLIEDHIIQEPI